MKIGIVPFMLACAVGMTMRTALGQEVNGGAFVVDSLSEVRPRQSAISPSLLYGRLLYADSSVLTIEPMRGRQPLVIPISRVDKLEVGTASLLRHKERDAAGPTLRDFSLAG